MEYPEILLCKQYSTPFLGTPLPYNTRDEAKMKVYVWITLYFSNVARYLSRFEPLIVIERRVPSPTILALIMGFPDVRSKRTRERAVEICLMPAKSPARTRYVSEYSFSGSMAGVSTFMLAFLSTI